MSERKKVKDQQNRGQESSNLQKKALHMIGNAHIDPVWLWQWQDGFQEIKATFKSALDRMDEYEEFLFTSSSAAFYAWVEENAPEMFEKIRKRIAEGRWELAGGWWVQPDCNIPSGESFVRQGLYGQHYFWEKFGKLASYGYNVDSFGHAGSLPQILAGSGMNRYVFMRPMPIEKPLPGRVFHWEADDGTRVLAFRIPYEYCTWPKELKYHIERCAGEIKAPVSELMSFYGVGNHGGGPTKENIESIREMNGDPELPELIFSTPDRYFSSIEESNLKLPVFHGDLQHHASGCYAAHSGIKRWNRMAENRLLASEKLSVLASLAVGLDYPESFAHGWKQLLFNQFHDILAGTSLREAYEDARDMIGESLAIAGRSLNRAVQAISWAIDTEEDPDLTPIVVFNPHSWDSRMLVELETGACSPEDILLDDEGKQIYFQVCGSSAAARGRHKLVFTPQLPSFGYRTFTLIDHASPRAEEIRSRSLEADKPALPQAGHYFLENEWFRIEFDPETGAMVSLLDKESSFSFIGNSAGTELSVYRDTSDTWSHGVFAFDDLIGRCSLEGIRIVEEGPVKVVTAVTLKWNNSRIVQYFTLYRELKQIDLRFVVDWQERETLVKFRVPLNLDFRSAVTEIPYGAIERVTNGEEEPGQRWIDLSGQGCGTRDIFGLGLANDSKYSFSFRENFMEMTLLRTPLYAHHIPYEPEKEHDFSVIDQGIQEISCSLLPHRGGWRKSGIVQAAEILNQRPVAIRESGHAGVLPAQGSLLAIDQKQVILSALKQAEESSDLIIRCYESTGERADAVITLNAFGTFPGTRIKTRFKPHEIKTIKVSRDGTAEETNMLEWSEAEMLERTGTPMEP